jgi:hypothetical protein
MSLIFNFIKKNYIIILLASLVAFISYSTINFVGKYNNDDFLQKIDSLNKTIGRIEIEQIKLDSNITHYNQEISKIDTNIEKIKIEKTIINNIYHEKINNVNDYTDDQLDSFFAVRYGYVPKK